MLKKRLGDIWDKLPEIEHTKKYKDEVTGTMIYEVCGRKFMNTTPISEVQKCLELIDKNYGERARLAAQNLLCDWKAISHAFRAGYQLKEIYETGNLIYPLKDAKYILEIKKGKYHYQNDGIAEKLEDLISNIEGLSLKSNYPEKVDREFWDKWIIDVYGLCDYGIKEDEK